MDDTLRVVCPGPGAEKRYLKIHKVSALSYTECLLETQKTLVVTCDGGSSSERATIIGVRRYSPLPSSESLLFDPGETYYWISTSSGEKEGINNTQYGICAADNMRLVIHVRQHNEVTTTSSSRASFESAEDQEDLSQRDIPHVNPKFAAIAHSVSQPQRREQKIPDGLNQEQLQKVAALAQQGATGTFTFDTPLEHERKDAMGAVGKGENSFWDAIPLMQDVLSGASDSILLGTNRIGNEEGAFVVHEDIARSYEYQSNVAGFSSTQHVLFMMLFLFPGFVLWS
ncbi:Ephrin [Necator americanus]|uniref:Ephrin n=1 Tax=Necator americanus TaxID=51031 RepID=W2TY28_NECAM|nr:Ephrin [Necator americanus]ETN85927.1 Ephrin [Necator americanus]